MLDYNSCIKIINRLTPIFTKDVNIIGLDGIIIASSNKKGKILIMKLQE